MNLAKRSIAILLAVLTVVASCLVFVSAESDKVQPNARVNLPAGAVNLNVAGYEHGNANCIWYAEKATTVGDFTAKFAGSAKDMNYFAVAICDEKGIITYYNDKLGRRASSSDPIVGEKTDVAIPAGSFIIGVNGNLTADFNAFKAAAKVGKQVTVYNVLVKNTANVAEKKDLVGAGFTVTDPVNYSGGYYKFVENGKAYEVDDNAFYKNYVLTSGDNDHTAVAAVALEFSPDDGYIPMAFSGYSGTSAVCGEQYNIATKKYGYDVTGVINGAFFSMDSGANPTGTYGTLVGMIISNGKIASAHAGYSDSVVAFDSDGTMHIVKSSIDYKLFFNGTEIPNGLYYINKTGGSKNPSWTNNFYYYDTSCGRVCDTFTCCPGFEIICEKVDNTDLMVGSTLKGKVLEIRENSYGAALAENTYDLSNKFVLFAKAGSSHAAKIKELKAGDEISISANETVEASKEIMEHANSVITNVGWLVKDGVDQTLINSSIGTHSVTLKARWTAFGVKADGSYVYFTTDSEKVPGEEYLTGQSPAATLHDVAKAMIELGCVNVIRMDGGGSTAMYVKDLEETGKPGYAMVCADYNRPVGDCILVVKASSVRDAALEKALDELIAEAEKAYEESPSASLKESIDAAKALLDSDAPVSGDVKKMIGILGGALSGKAELSDLVAKVSAISYKDYSEQVLEGMRKAYDEAVAVIGNKEATAKEVEDAYNKLNRWYQLTGETEIIVTTGAAYTTTTPSRGDTYDDDEVRLTDGSKGNTDGGSAKYSGWGSKDKTKPNVISVIVDLGEAAEFNTFRTYFAGGNWGIDAGSMQSLTAYISDDRNTFTQVAITETKVHTGGDEAKANSWNTYVFEAKADKVCKARYIKFDITAFGGNAFVWLDEVEASLAVEPVKSGLYITAFNSGVTSGSCMFFTPTIGELTAGNANLNWSKNLLLEYDEELGAYKVVERWNGSGTTKIGTTGQTALKEGQLIIAAHDWETGVTDGSKVEGSAENARRVSEAKIGDILITHGIDMEGETIGVGAYFELVTPEEPKPASLIGDVNLDGKIDAKDYMLLKRHCLKTFTLEDEALACADINGDNKVNATDYLLLKRHCLKTYEIVQPQ